MKKNVLILLGGLLVIAACKTTASEEKPPVIPVETFFKNPEKTYFRISPDGQFIAYLAPLNGIINVFVMKSGDTSAIPVTKDSVRNIYRYGWKGNKIIYSQDIGGDENFQLFSAATDGSQVKALTPFPKVRTEILNDLAMVKGREQEIIVACNKRDPRYLDPYYLNVETGEMKEVYKNDLNFSNWFFDNNGVLRLASLTNGVDVSYFYRANDSTKLDSLLTTNFRESFYPQNFTPDNQHFYAMSNIGRDKVAAVEFDPATRKEVKEIYKHADYDLGGINYSEKQQKIISISYTGEKDEYFFTDKPTEEIFNKLKQELPGKTLSLYGSDLNEERFIVYAGSDKTVAFHLFDVKSGKTSLLANSKPWLDEANLASVKPILYKSRDGLDIRGYLTLPKGVEAKNLPLVVNPHGGPWARDGWYMNEEVQFLANRGYAVLQMNFRGSTGYGRKFWEAGFKQWGKAMQDDITDGVKWLTDQGIADPKRVAIYGASYGGYATLAGVAFTPDLYAAGVDYVGVSNLFTFMNTIPPYWEPYRKMFYEMVGDPGSADSVFLREASPVFHVDKIKAPLLIAQGANDPRVNKAESDQMVEALKARGIAVEYLVKNDEGHGFANEKNQIDFYKAMESFLAKHLAIVNDKSMEPGKQP